MWVRICKLKIMKKEEIIKFIGKIELFDGLTLEELTLVADNLESLSYKQNEYLFKENDSRNYTYVIKQGSVKLIKRTALGKDEQIATFESGDFFGEGALTDDSKHSTSALAESNITAVGLPKAFYPNNGSIALKLFSNIARVISRRMRHANNKIANSAAQYESGRTRKEHDLLGWRDVPHGNYYGVQTLRAMENFNISGISLNYYPDIINSLAIVKRAAAEANYEQGLFSEKIHDAIIEACKEVQNGKYHYHFTVDMIQGGAGTSTNMNANEVIANRALEIMGYEKGDYEHCHPNNHINLSQSTNDAYPTAIHLALIYANKKLVNVLGDLIKSFRKKEKEFEQIIKMGRTQLQDAVPMTLGQTFGAFAASIEDEITRLNSNADLFLEVNMGATAIGTGINSEPGYPEKVITHLREITGWDIYLAENLMKATSDTGSFVMYSSAVKRLAVKLSKICNDLRLLSSGPRCGLNEINLPAMQPGSSIMPGKVNPVIPEVVNQIAFKVIGNDLTVTMASEAGQLELNVMEPVIVQSLFESIEMLKSGMETLIHRCIDGITANEEHCKSLVENSIGLVTALNPFIGYENSSSIAKEALKTGGSVYNLVLERNLLSKAELDNILKPENMIHPNKMK